MTPTIHRGQYKTIFFLVLLLWSGVVALGYPENHDLTRALGSIALVVLFIAAPFSILAYGSYLELSSEHTFRYINNFFSKKTIPISDIRFLALVFRGAGYHMDVVYQEPSQEEGYVDIALTVFHNRDVAECVRTLIHENERIKMNKNLVKFLKESYPEESFERYLSTS